MNDLRDKETQYNIFLNYKQEKKKGVSFGRVLLIILTLIAFLSGILLMFLGLSNFSMAKKTEKITFAGTEIAEQSDFGSSIGEKLVSILPESLGSKVKAFLGSSSVHVKHNLGLFKQRQNILVLGIDSNGAGSDAFIGTRTDTIILVNVDPQTKTVNAISIPRDSKVYLAGEHGINKINSAHALGGIDLAKKTIEDTLGVKIDKYILLNTAGTKKLVDVIGGVPIYIEKDMYYNDNSGNLHINLKKGPNVLNGDQAEGYIRYRKDGLGDIGRTSRQQWFMRALLKKLQTAEALSKIPEMINLSSIFVKTDLSLYEMSHLAALLRSVDMEQIEVATLPGGPSRKGKVSYWILDPEKTQEVVNRLVYRDKPKLTDKKLVAGIMYSFDKEEEAMLVKDKLNKIGYKVDCIGRAQLPHSQIIGHTETVSGDFINWLKKRVPELKQSQFVYDPIRMYCVDSDFTIIITDS